MKLSIATVLLAATCASTLLNVAFTHEYSYDKVPFPYDRHNFGPLPTLVPLPPIPPLPALPTPTSGSVSPSKVFVSQSAPLVQVHPSPVAKVVQQYRAPPSTLRPVYSAAPPSSVLPSTVETVVLSYGKPTLVTFPETVAPSAPAAIPSSSSSLPPIFTTTSNNKLIVGLPERRTTQYDVMEVIDNDIEREMVSTVLNTPFIDGYRARYGLTRGSTIQDLALLTQELQGIHQRLNAGLMNPADTVALGSGGLGFVRLPNGNIFLGSGSLGYISGSQHNQSVADARTRAENATPDPLHFGHGPRPLPSNVLPIVLRFRT